VPELRWQLVLGADCSSRWISWWGTAYGGWSHVDFLLPGGGCLGARSDRIPPGTPPGVQLRPDGYEKWKTRKVLALPCTDEESQAAVAFEVNQINDPYDKRDILGLLLGRPISSGSGWWICSALQLAMLEYIGRMPKLSVTPQQCSPDMFAAVLEAIGAKEAECAPAPSK
jgi:hypothetical protein